MSWRSTRLVTRDNCILNIPNSVVSDSYIKNFNYPDELYEHRLTVYIDPMHFPERVKKIILDALLTINEIMTSPKPFVRFKGANESSCVYGVFYYSDNYGNKNEIEEIVWGRVFVHLKRAGIIFAIQRQRIFLSREMSILNEESFNPDSLLEEIELFKPFSDEDRNFISQRIRHHKIKKGQTVVKQGGKGDSLFIIVEGVVVVTMELEDESIIELGRLGTENIFGEMALLTGEPRTANVITLTEAYLLEIHKEDIAPIIEAHPEVSELLSEILLQRKQRTKSIISNKYSSDEDESELPKKLVAKILHYFGVKIKKNK